MVNNHWRHVHRSQGVGLFTVELATYETSARELFAHGDGSAEPSHSSHSKMERGDRELSHDRRFV
jgi:hypothetical protein